LLPRLHDSSGVHRSPAVGLVVVGLLKHSCHVRTTDLFPMTLAAGSTSRNEPVDWSAEGKRLVDFMGSRAQLVRKSRPYPEALFRHESPVVSLPSQ